MLRSRPLPAPLCDGARVGVFAPAGPVDRRRLAEGVRALEAGGFEVLLADNLGERDGYLAGDDAARLAGIESLLAAGVGALIAARGGYGTTRLLPRLPMRRLADWGGWVVGGSDLTALHAALSTGFPTATLHGPMVAALGRHDPSTRLLFRWLRGRPPRTLWRLDPRQVVRGGRRSGVGAGGNLAVLAALGGSPFAPDTDGAVLFLEDVNEPLYRLDRELTQLSQSSRLASVSAIVAGRFHRCGSGEPRFRKRLRALLAEAAPPDAVVVEGVAFGHGLVNVPFPLGVEVTVDTERGVIGWGGT